MKNILKTVSLTLSVTALLAISTVSHAKGDRFTKLDANTDGKLSVEEYTSKSKKPEKAAKKFAKSDLNKDGFLTKEEVKTMSEKNKAKKGKNKKNKKNKE